jgi:hypothetical protein
MPKHKAKPKRDPKRQPTATKHGNKRVKAHRDRLRAAGLKPIQLWVWDTTRPGFAEQVQRECEIINASAEEQRVLAEIEAVADFEGWV